jgi:hypothetical protein
MIVVINFKPSKSPLQARFSGGEESLQPNRKNKEMITVINFNPNPKQHWEMLHCWKTLCKQGSMEVR